MSAPTGKQAAAPQNTWPTDTYETDSWRLYNGEGVFIYHPPNAHSDGDSYILFRKSDVISVGDILSLASYPVIKASEGGSINGLIDALNDIIAMLEPKENEEGGTYVIPGHGHICDRHDVVNYRDMVTIIRGRIQNLINKGMTRRALRQVHRPVDHRYVCGSDLQRSQQEQNSTKSSRRQMMNRQFLESFLSHKVRCASVAALLLVATCGSGSRVTAQEDAPAARKAPATAKAQALIGKRVADTWDPAKDEREGNNCRAYGAANILRIPERLHVTWENDNTLRMDTDAGMQTRLFHFDGSKWNGGQPQWQGDSVAAWEKQVQTGGAAGRFGGPVPGKGGTLHVVTTHMKPGYLRKNGVPYSGNAVLTEYFDRFDRNGVAYLIVTSVVDDPQYLNDRFIISGQFKREPDASKWNPTPCRPLWPRVTEMAHGDRLLD
jgi:hypothetical protein